MFTMETISSRWNNAFMQMGVLTKTIYHCKVCRKVVCSKCSRKRKPLAINLGSKINMDDDQKPVRVCDMCSVE